MLTHDGPAREGEVVTTLRSWWEAWPVRARLPWLLEALDLLTDRGAVEGSAALDAAASLWVDGAELIRRDPASTSRGELALWRRIAGRLGIDASTVVEYLGSLQGPGDLAVPDPLRDLPAERVAIVSLNERAARGARDILRERTTAEILVVCEQVAGAATTAAKAADVILFAWAANKHAVFRTFDGVRDRVEFVAGKGASSIVTALERWADRVRGAELPRP